MAVKRKGLGKGLDSLIPENKSVKPAAKPEKAEEPVKTGEQMLKINQVEPNREQPRKHFEEDALLELADSIKQYGVLQPLLVRKRKDYYEIIAGERRWRAAKLAGVKEVPVIIKEYTEQQAVEIALIENIQREDLNPIEEAMGYRQLMEEYHFTQDQVANSVGKSRPAIANSLRLLNLPEEVIALLQQGDLSFGQGKAILAFEDPEKMVEIAELTVKKGLTVRQLEAMAKKEQQQPKQKAIKIRDSYFDEVEIALSNELSRKIKIDVNKQDHGTLHIDFYSKEELKELAKKLAENM